MQPTIAIIEEEDVTILTIGFPDGESKQAFFFPEPETKEEAKRQYSWKIFAAIMLTFGFDRANEDDSGPKWRTRYIWAFIGSAVVAYFAPLLGTLCGLLIALTIPFFAKWWIQGEPKRAEARTQQEWLARAFRQLRPYAEQNDFRGALQLAFQLCRT
jgi:hypothetical protein